jgi:hypothetical protein
MGAKMLSKSQSTRILQSKKAKSAAYGIIFAVRVSPIVVHQLTHDSRLTIHKPAIEKQRNSMYRSHTCGELTISDVNKEVTLAGWVQTVRNLAPSHLLICATVMALPNYYLVKN